MELKERQRLYSKDYYERNKDKPGFKKVRDEYLVEWKKKNPEKVRENSRKANLAKFGLSTEEYNDMLLSQNGLCAICDKVETFKFKGEIKNLCIDHNHETGEVRGLLCHKCNLGIGHLEDDKEILQKAIEYLEKYEEN